MLDSKKIGESFSIHDAMQTITLEVLLECVFGIPPGPRHEDFRQMLHAVMTEGARPMTTVARALLPGAELRDFAVRRLAPLVDRLASFPPFERLVPLGGLSRATRDLHRAIFDHIAKRRASGTEGRTDVMSMLLAVRDEDGRGFTDDELRDEMITLLIAGHETTATALAFALSKLLSEPLVQGRVREELARVLGDAPLSLRSACGSSSTSTRPSRRRCGSTGHRGDLASARAADEAWRLRFAGRHHDHDVGLPPPQEPPLLA